MGSRLLIRNARVLDVEAGDYVPSCSVLVEQGRIVEVGTAITATGADTVDATDRVLMPGLIDAHVHPMISSVDIGSLASQPLTLLAQKARVELEAMVRRGFTTARDACGGDAGLVRAIEAGLINGPRLFVSGRALSQTGGHGDSRPLADQCAGHTDQFARIADGVDAVRAAARAEFRSGVHQIKVMASGGVASPSDEVWTLQYSLEELRAVVEEATARRSYVLAHAYTAEAVERAVMSGVRSIEHGNLITADTAALMSRHGTFLVPTLVTYEQLHQSGDRYGMPPDQLRKVGDVIDAGLDAVRLARSAGAKVGFGTDLLGELQVHQNGEFRIRSRGEEPIDIIRSATTVNAELVGLAGRAGIVAAGADADLLLVDGDPLSDVTHLADPERIDSVIRGGDVAFRR
jgi:imidazolonepropionase-like amidohydrolase